MPPNCRRLTFQRRLVNGEARAIALHRFAIKHPNLFKKTHPGIYNNYHIIRDLPQALDATAQMNAAVEAKAFLTGKGHLNHSARM